MSVEEKSRILLVDDDSAMRDSLSHLLQSADFSTQTVDDGDQVVQRLAQYQPDAILCDVRMPVMGGLELLKFLKGRGDTTPLILMSAHGDVPMAVEAMQDGAYSFIEKPFEPRRLLALLGNAVRYRNLYRQAEALRGQLSDLSGFERGGAQFSTPIEPSPSVDEADHANKIIFDELPSTLREAMAVVERKLISDAIIACDARMDEVAERLGIGRRTLNEKIVKLGIEKASLLGA